MSRLTSFLLAFAQLTFVHGLPAGDSKRNVGALNERDIAISNHLRTTTSYTSAIETLQSVSPTVAPSLTGSILIGLPAGGFTRDPLHAPGAKSHASVLLSPNETPLAPGPTAPVGQVSSDIFQPIATGGPAPSIEFTGGHVVKKQYIVDGDVPIETNKFYANFFLGSQGSPVWTHPYSLSWAKGIGNTYGIAISHVERDKFAFGGGPSSDEPQYFVAPIGIHSMVLSAAELGSSTYLSLEDLKGFSVYANLAASQSSRVLMSIPCVQGMGFVTAIYDKARPLLSTGVFFRTLDYVKPIDGTDGATYKYRIQLNDGTQWLLYATPITAEGVPPFRLINSTTIAGPKAFVGMIQVTKNPAGAEGESVFDSSAGAYAESAAISGSVDGSSGSYSLTWAKGGIKSQTLLMYALPHHVESFDQDTKAALKNITLVTTTKGYARAVLADRITMVENDLPDSIGFAPWAKAANGAGGGSENINLNSGARALVNQVGISELSQDINKQTRLNSMYYSGKGLAKFAAIIYTLNSMTGNSHYAAAGLDRLKDAFNVFVNNTQPEPLVYDTVWKGVVSSATYSPPYDTGLDFGNTLYNDHHFHYGYFVWTAAVIGHLDPTWLDEGSNKAWVNSLARDYASPVADAYFPFSRSFDWFHGHSWAKGLFESGDGKDQESTSEDAFATYALKMWGKIIRDPNMEARGNLQLAVQARSYNNYFLLTSDNKNQPPQFLHNKVTGILFENKIDHTTYFGSNTEYIEGIHMLPLNPSSAYTRRQKFVQEEWDTYFSNGRVDKVQAGWKSVLYANLALIDPQTSYNFFADPNFDTDLDGGASRTWYLAYSAALLGAENGDTEQDAEMDYPTSSETQSENEEPAETADEDEQETQDQESEAQDQEPEESDTQSPEQEQEQQQQQPEEQDEDAQEQNSQTQYQEPEESDAQSEEPEQEESGEQDSQAQDQDAQNQEVQDQDVQDQDAQESQDQDQEPEAQDQEPQETAAQQQDNFDEGWPRGFNWPKKANATAQNEDQTEEASLDSEESTDPNSAPEVKPTPENEMQQQAPEEQDQQPQQQNTADPGWPEDFNWPTYPTSTSQNEDADNQQPSEPSTYPDSEAELQQVDQDTATGTDASDMDWAMQDQEEDSSTDVIPPDGTSVPGDEDDWEYDLDCDDDADATYPWSNAEAAEFGDGGWNKA